MRRCPDRLPAPPDTILRFVTTERLLHWAIAIPFMGCFVSAVVLLVVYNPDPARPYRLLFAWMHRGCGAALILCPSFVLLANLRRLRIHFYNIRQAWLWTFDDIKWLVFMGPAALSKRVTLPDQGKFNAAEKLNFMMVMAFTPLFIASGALIWFPDTSGLDTFGPWMVHCALAALATPLLVGHVIMATINPSTRVGLEGMITGFVSREWAAHHYTRWFREQFPDLAEAHGGEVTSDAQETAAASAGADLRPQPATVGQLPFERTPQSPVVAVCAPLGSTTLGNPSHGESTAHAPTSPSIPFSTQSPFSPTQQARPQLRLVVSAVAPPQQSGFARAAEHDLDRFDPTTLLVDASGDDAVAGSPVPGSVGSAIDDTEDADVQENGDAGTPRDAA